MGYRAIVDLCLSNNITQRVLRNNIKKLEIEIKKTKRPSTGQIVDVISEKDAEKVLSAIMDIPVLKSSDITLNEAAEELGIVKTSVLARCKTRKIGQVKKYPSDYEDVRLRSQKVFCLSKKEFNQLKGTDTGVEVLNLVEE